MIGFSPYIQALLGWMPGLTTVFCYRCRSFTQVFDDPIGRTFRCGRIDCGADLLKQPVHLSALQSDEQDDTDSTEVDS